MQETTSNESQGLASYAAQASNSRGRAVAEAGPGDRNEFQRDCSRIIHSKAFRRLQDKTQVFATDEGDLFRTRLTHSMEVAQISRSVARALRLNEDLCETIGLAHDVGHAPFGHLGQDVLHEMMAARKMSFEHNLQGLRIVDELEEPYLNFKGLNLLYETREGILKHCSAKNARKLGELGQRFLDRKSPSLEAQLVNWCDAIAYNHADIEDGIREKVLSVKQVREGIPQFNKAFEKALAAHPDVPQDDPRLWREAVGLMMKVAISDLIKSSAESIAKSGVKTLDDVRNSPELITFSPGYEQEHKEMKRFLMKNLYKHPEVTRMRDLEREILEGLFQAYERDPSLVSKQFGDELKGATDSEKAQKICDHVAGMTDGFAKREFQRVVLNAPTASAPRSKAKSRP